MRDRVLITKSGKRIPIRDTPGVNVTAGIEGDPVEGLETLDVKSDKITDSDDNKQNQQEGLQK